MAVIVSAVLVMAAARSTRQRFARRTARRTRAANRIPRVNSFGIAYPKPAFKVEIRKIYMERAQRKGWVLLHPRENKNLCCLYIPFPSYVPL